MDGSYRGPDRRCADPDDGASAGALVLAATTGAGAGALLAAVQPADVEAQLAVAAVVGVAPLVVATVLLLCAWRAGGRARPAHAAVALALAGGAGPLSAWLASGAAGPAATGPVVVALAAGLLAAAPHARAARAARRTAAVDSGLRPVAALLGGSGLVLAAAAGAALLGAPAWSPAWSLPWSPAWSLVGTAALGAAGGAAVAGALATLRGALRGQHLRVLRAVADLQRAAADLQQDRLLRHDARSALAAVRAASAVLTGERAAVLDPRVQRELAAAVHGELGRVERLLGAPGEATAPPTPGVVDLRRAVAPLVVAWRARGLDVTGPPPGPPVLGVGTEDAVRRAVGNLLDNAQRHAPGAAVTISATSTAGAAVLVVHDDGPGVPARHREAAFAAGTSLAPGSAGQGLGLASARALAEADGGSLRLLDADRGARFELHLPPAHRTPEEVAAR